MNSPPARGDNPPPRVTVLTGYLGAGKTTLVNHLLSADHGYRIAVIVNEAGDIGIDGDLVVSSDEEVIEMANGCVCCTLSVRQDLTATLKKLLERPDSPRYFLIEASGLADPVPLTQALFVDGLADQLVLDGVITMVDSQHIEHHLDRFDSNPADSRAADQILCADRIVLNKTDLVGTSDCDRIEGRIRTLNSTAPLIRTRYARVDPGLLLGIGAFDPARQAVESGRFGIESEPADPTLQATSLEVFDELDRTRLLAWLQALVDDRAEDIHRIKGILALAGETQPIVLQGVRSVFELYPGGSWSEGRSSRLVVIGRDLDEEMLREGLAGCRVEQTH